MVVITRTSGHYQSFGGVGALHHKFFNIVTKLYCHREGRACETGQKRSIDWAGSKHGGNSENYLTLAQIS
jgi:hypothetical protein